MFVHPFQLCATSRNEPEENFAFGLFSVPCAWILFNIKFEINKKTRFALGDTSYIISYTRANYGALACVYHVRYCLSVRAVSRLQTVRALNTPSTRLKRRPRRGTLSSVRGAKSTGNVRFRKTIRNCYLSCKIASLNVNWPPKKKKKQVVTETRCFM